MSLKYLSVFLLALLLALAACDNDVSKTPKPEAAAPSSGEESVQAGQEAPEPSGVEATAKVAAPADAKSGAGDEAAQPAAPAEPATAEAPVAATVNGTPISSQVLESQMALGGAELMAYLEREGLTDEEREKVFQAQRLEVLGNLISLELACQEALRLGYAPPDEEVEEALRSFKEGYDNPDEPLDQLLERFGSTEADLREQLVKTLALEKWQENNFLAQIKVSDQEAREFYDQNLEAFRHGDLVRLSQIYLAVPLLGTPAQLEKAKATAKAKGESALKRLQAGDDFGQVAAEMSNEPGAAASRGDQGWMGKDQPLPVFGQAVLEMKPGQVSELLESPMGYYIYKVTETKPAGLEPFESAKPGLTDYLSGEKLGPVLREKMSELYQKADIQILDPKLKELYDRLAAEAAAPAPAAEEPGDQPAGQPEQKP